MLQHVRTLGQNVRTPVLVSEPFALLGVRLARVRTDRCQFAAVVWVANRREPSTVRATRQIRYVATASALIAPSGSDSVGIRGPAESIP